MLLDLCYRVIHPPQSGFILTKAFLSSAFIAIYSILVVGGKCLKHGANN